MRVELCPPNSHGAVSPSPMASECILIWRQSLYRAVPGRMRSVGCFRIQKDSCLYKEGKFGDRRRGRVPCEDWTYSATNQGTPRAAGKPPEVGTHGTDPSSQLRRKQPCKPSISYLQPPGPRDNIYFCLRRPSVVLCYVGPRKPVWGLWAAFGPNHEWMFLL